MNGSSEKHRYSRSNFVIALLRSDKNEYCLVTLFSYKKMPFSEGIFVGFALLLPVVKKVHGLFRPWGVLSKGFLALEAHQGE